MSDNEDNTPDQIPLLRDIVYDASLPLKAPPRPPRIPRPMRNASDHGPDYDPDTLDLFKTSAEVQPALRAEADKVLEELVEEYSREIVDRLREELSVQLESLLEDLSPDGENTTDQ